MITKNIVPARVFFKDGLDHRYQKVAFEPGGLVIFLEEQIQFIPWHRIYLVQIGKPSE